MQMSVFLKGNSIKEHKHVVIFKSSSTNKDTEPHITNIHFGLYSILIEYFNQVVIGKKV